MQRPNGTDGHHVRNGKERCKGPAISNKLLGGIVTILTGETNPLIVLLFVIFDAVLPEGLQAAFIAEPAGIGVSL